MINKEAAEFIWDVLDGVKSFNEEGGKGIEALNLAIKALKNERPQGEIVKCQNCKYRVKEWREDKRMKEKGYWVYGCKHFGEIMGYWGFGGSDDEFCSDAERADMRGAE